jgi:hypothetical protein
VDNHGTAPEGWEAHGLLLGRDVLIRVLSRKSHAELAAMDLAQLAERGTVRVHGGPLSHDELVSTIVSRQYPLEKLNEAIHVLYHTDRLSSSACQWCHPHSGGDCHCELGR